MSAISIPVSRPSGRALVVATAAVRPVPIAQLHQLGCSCAEYDDSYAAMAELCRRPAEYTALILSLSSLYREELAIIESVKRRFPQIEIWLTQTDGRLSSLAEAMRLGADGLLADDGLHRIASPPIPIAPHPTLRPHGPMAVSGASPATAAANVTAVAVDEPATHSDPIDESDFSVTEPVLTADELRALLQETPDLPSGRMD
jgi:hypothetical protein